MVATVEVTVVILRHAQLVTVTVWVWLTELVVIMVVVVVVEAGGIGSTVVVVVIVMMTGIMVREEVGIAQVVIVWESARHLALRHYWYCHEIIAE